MGNKAARESLQKQGIIPGQHFSCILYIRIERNTLRESGRRRRRKILGSCMTPGLIYKYLRVY